MSTSDEDVLTDWCRRLETLAERFSTDDLSTLLASDAELRSQTSARPELLETLEQWFAASREMQTLLCGANGSGSRVPDIAGFVVEEEIGRGGIGVVFRARELGLERQVAIKTLTAGRLADGRLRQRFHREAQTMAALKHPGIVPVYQTGEADGVPYFSMELVEGGTLADRLRRETLCDREAGKLTLTLAEAIGYAHAQGVIHRDLKPSNVLLTLTGEPKIGDFGLARVLEQDARLTRTSETPGTPSYMAPEQIQGLNSPATDVYALGAVLYEMLTCRAPFLGQTQAETLLLVQGAEPTRPRAVRAEVNRDLEAICLKCLEKDPEQRYASAASLAVDLQRYLDGQPILARRIGTVARAARWIGRRRVLVGLMLVAAVSLSFAAFSAVRHGRAMVVEQQQNQELRRASLAREEQLRDYEYVANLREAYQAWPKGDAQHVQRILLRSAPKPGQRDRRGFVWRHLWSSLHGQPLSISAHEGPVFGLAFSPDGAWLASGGRDGLVQVHDTATGQLKLTLAGHTQDVNDVHGSPDGRWWLSSSDDGTIRLWDARGGGLLQLIDSPAPRPACAVFLPDGQRVVSADRSSELSVWEALSGKLLARVEGHAQEVNHLAVSAASNRLASASSDGTIRLWDATTLMPLATLAGHSYSVTHVDFSPDGRFLATSGSDRTVRLWQVDPPTLLTTWTGHNGRVDGVAFTADGRQVASVDSSGALRTWDVERRSPVPSCLAQQGRLRTVAGSPTAAMVATAGDQGTLKLWHHRPATVVRLKFDENGSSFGTQSQIRFAPAGDKMSVSFSNGSRRTLRLDSSGRWTLSQEVGNVEARIAAEGFVDLIARDETSQMRHFQFPVSRRLADPSFKFAKSWTFSPLGRWFALRVEYPDESTQVDLYETRSPDAAVATVHTESTDCWSTFSDDERLFVIATGPQEKGRVIIVDLPDGSLRYLSRKELVNAYALAMSPDKLHLVGGGLNQVWAKRVDHWDAPPLTWPVPGHVQAVAISPTEPLFVCVTREEAQIRVFSLFGGEQVATLELPFDVSRHLLATAKFSADGRHLALLAEVEPFVLTVLLYSVTRDGTESDSTGEIRGL